MHVQALYPADGILPVNSSKLQLLFIILASVAGGQLVSSPTAAILGRYLQFLMTHSAIIKFLLLSIILGGLFFKAEANKCSSESFRDTIKIISKRRFDYFIKMADTSTEVQKKYHENVASCIWGTYKIISDKYILRIKTNFFSEDRDGYYEIDVDSLLRRKTVEILVYDSANSTLQNICTDVGDWNNLKANRKLRPSGGKIIVAFTKANTPYHEHTVTLFIKELNFYDPISNKSIFLKHVLAWKINWEGIPG